MKRKGFTLIELLAVIVILAIIAIIAIPIVLNIINSANESSKLRSKELYLKAVDEAIARKNLTSNFNPSECTVNSDGNITCDEIELVIEVKGEKPCSGTITYENGKRISEDVAYCSGSLVVESKPNAPELMDSLTPVIYDEETSKWKVVAKTDSNWYNYDKQKWANAVIVREGVSKDVGTLLTVPSTKEEITSSDILAMFVWIPRYEYKIDTTDGQFGKGSKDKTLPGEIEVNFISGKGTSATEGYTIHPAFTFGEDELSGIWVGKFETSDETSSSTTADNLWCSNENCTSSDKLRILPNVLSLRNNKVSNSFFATRSMSREGNIFKIDKSKTDTHMMKNSEWGAVAYLSQSKYGKYGNGDYQGADKEVYINNAYTHTFSYRFTGKSGGSPNASVESNEYSYNEKINGTGASTTGNIYGIYDMSGGAIEYVMGNYKDYASHSDFDETWFANNTKYYDKYTNSCSEDECKGHALEETERWYSDSPANYTDLAYPWIVRGGGHNYGSSAGLFAYNRWDGGSDIGYSFRIVLAPSI